MAPFGLLVVRWPDASTVIDRPDTPRHPNIFETGTRPLSAGRKYGQRACRRGDSGAPVFDLVGPTYNNVVARGIISACNADQGGDYVYYAKFTDAQTDFGYIVPLVAF